MPRKVFVAGEILTAADVNTNLMDQAVMVFGGTATRGSAIPSPSEGMVTYLEDSNQVQVYDGSAWGAVGKILQVVNATYSTQTTTTSTASFVTTGLSASITPSSTSNKILVLHSGAGGMNGTVGANSVYFTLFRGTVSDTNLGDANNGLLVIYGDVSSTYRIWGSLNMSYLDSPNTTSSQTYTVGMKATVNNSAIAQRGSIPSVLTLLEVAG